MAITLNSPDWQIAGARTKRGTAADAPAPPDLPLEFLTPHSSIRDTFVAEPGPTLRGAAAAPRALDFTCDLSAGESAVVAVRHASGALTFHPPVETTRVTRGSEAKARFVVPMPPGEQADVTRGVFGRAIKVMVVAVTRPAIDAVAGMAMRALAAAVEQATWDRANLVEGWLKVDKAALGAGRLLAVRPASPERSLLLLHGTFSNAASAYSSLKDSDFFEQVAPLYGDRIFAFDHFSVSRTPEDNARLLLERLPDRRFLFDVVTHSRGGLVLRTLVERAAVFGALASRFTLGRAVLVAAPNGGTPLATPKRWEDTIGWLANLLEIFPDNPFTTGASFVANGIVWMAGHVAADLPGLQAMDGDGDPIRQLQGPPAPPADRYSALVANYNPSGDHIRRLLDAGVDQFFSTANDLVVPSEGGWQLGPPGGTSVAGGRIGCFGAGGNIGGDVTHTTFFSQPAAIRFIVGALAGQRHALAEIDPTRSLPDRRLVRAAGAVALAAPGAQPAVAAATVPATRDDPRATAAAASRPALVLTVVNGDLSFERHPLLIGHYQSTRLTGGEHTLDVVLGGSMSGALDLGVYPSAPGTQRIFINTHVGETRAWLTPRPEAVIVVGLGAEGQLKAMDLVRTVRQAVVAWAERRAEDERGDARARRPRQGPEPLALSTTLLGSGGAGITPGQAAQLIAQGAHEANLQLERHVTSAGRALPQVRELRFIELYLDRAAEAWRSLKMHATTNRGQFTVHEPIVEGPGAIRRPPEPGYRGAGYDFITAETIRRPDGTTSIAYALDTSRARTEIRAQQAQSGLLRNLVAHASSDETADAQIGRTLFQLLVPIELESFLAASGEMQIEVDEGTAGIPWELLDDRQPDKTPNDKPWAIRANLLRKFRTAGFRQQVKDADAGAAVLVIGEPACPPEYPALPGARQEAFDVFATLTSDRGLDARSVRALLSDRPAVPGPDARTVINALFERDWRIVHIAGHGEPAGPNNEPGGVVLSGKVFLGPAEIKALRVVPELVFVNCCYVGGLGTRSVLEAPYSRLYDRTLFASSVAEELIKIGVRCVVAAGWAVMDDGAAAFAKRFYQSLLDGARFIDAVGHARRAAFDKGGNTWAAYQCYGDPDWMLRPDPAKQQASAPSPHEFDSVGSIPALELALDALLVQTNHQSHLPAFSPDNQRARARLLEARWQQMQWPLTGQLAERFANVFAAVADFEHAIEWYDRAFESGDSAVSFGAVEHAANLRVRLAWQRVEAAMREMEAPAAPRAAERPRSRTATPRPAEQRALARRKLGSAIASARAVITRETRRLARLAPFTRSPERETVYGSAMKRLAMVEGVAGRHGAEQRAFKAMKAHYSRAVALDPQASNLFYPAMQLLVADLAINAGRRGWRGLDPNMVAAARQSFESKNQDDPDFWSLAAQTELRLYEVVARGTLADDAAALERGYTDLFRRSRGAKHWSSVYDTANFVLARYGPRASRAEQQAATHLLDLLRKQVQASEGRDAQPK